MSIEEAVEGGDCLTLSDGLECPSINSQTRWKLCPKSRTLYLGLKEQHITQEVWSKTGKIKSPSGNQACHDCSPVPGRCHTVQCNLWAALPPPGFALWLLHCLCRSRWIDLFPDLTPGSLGWRQLTAARSCYEAEATKPLRFPRLLQRIHKTFSAGFTANPPTLRSNHILMTHPIMLRYC